MRNFHIFIAIDMKRSIEMKALTGKIAIITGAGPNGIRVNAILPGAVDTPSAGAGDDRQKSFRRKDWHLGPIGALLYGLGPIGLGTCPAGCVA